MGARLAKDIDGESDYRIGTIGLPKLSANDTDMAGTQTRTHLIVTGDDDTGMSMFSTGGLLGRGAASEMGKDFVSESVKRTEKVQADVSAVLALDSKPGGLDAILESQWAKFEVALTDIFGSSSIRTTALREKDILDDIADILDSLSNEVSFVAETHDDRDKRGVLRSTALGVGAAADAFNRLTRSAEVTLDMTGSTR